MCTTKTLIRHSNHNPTNPLGRFKVSDSDSSPLSWQDEWASRSHTLSFLLPTCQVKCKKHNSTNSGIDCKEQKPTKRQWGFRVFNVSMPEEVLSKCLKVVPGDSLLTKSSEIPSRWITYSIGRLRCGALPEGTRVLSAKTRVRERSGK